jgi:hypothetical protein
MSLPIYPGAPPNSSTMLVLSVMGVPLYSARGLSQTLEPIGGSKNMRRSINGVLTDLAYVQFRKYQSKITCTDMRAPAIDGIWPGMIIVVDCVAYLSYRSGGSAQRLVVEGSSFTEGGFVYYRPRLTMMVTSYTTQADEWAATAPWELDLEEVN